MQESLTACSDCDNVECQTTTTLSTAWRCTLLQCRVGGSSLFVSSVGSCHAYVCSLSNAQSVQQINSSSFNVFCSSCLLLSVCNLAQWPAHSKRARAVFHSVGCKLLTWINGTKSGLVKKSHFLPVMKCFEQTQSPLPGSQAEPSLLLRETKVIHLQRHSFSLGKQYKLIWQCFD